MTGSASNAYSQNWFEFFHVGIPETRTIQEIDFVCAHAPLPRFCSVLDVCCGMGRHARSLAGRGYSVIGIDRDARAIARARELGGGPTYLEADVRNYQPDIGTHDLAIVMSQSFGYFDAATNRDLLPRIASGLRKGGRVILDLWNPQFFERHSGERDFEFPGGIVHEKKQMKNSRLYVRLDYSDGGVDDFEWQLFTPSEMAALANSAGMAAIVSCTDFNAATKRSSTNPRIQFVLERLDP